ncbi:MAG: RNA polymerase sigma factor [Chloroflexi bacterium]|nr:RNA polymerase sigma factor [Chloroflexota bacterium]
MDTLQLLQDYQAGDALAVEMFVRAHQQAVYRLALSVLDDPAEADEASQDSLVAAINALDSYRGESAFTTWLYAITLNVCRARLRKRGSRERLIQALHAIFRLKGETAAHPEETAIKNEADAAVLQAVNRLDEKHRLPIVLRYYNDFSIAEIAQLLGINEGTVHSRLYTARERLRMMLKRSIDFELQEAE